MQIVKCDTTPLIFIGMSEKSCNISGAGETDLQCECLWIPLLLGLCYFIVMNDGKGHGNCSGTTTTHHQGVLGNIFSS